MMKAVLHSIRNYNYVVIPSVLSGIVMWMVGTIYSNLFILDIDDQYHFFEIAISLLAYIVLGSIMSYFYRISKEPFNSFLRGIKIGLMFGVLWIILSGLTLITLRVPDLSQKIVNTLYHIIEQGIGGIIIFMSFKYYVRLKFFFLNNNENNAGLKSNKKTTGLESILNTDFLAVGEENISVESEMQNEVDKNISFLRKKGRNDLKMKLNQKASDKEAKNKVLNPDNVIKDRIDEKQFENYVILVVEDDDEIRLLIVSFLEQYYNILEASDGKTAWEIARNKMPNIIISDIMMPEMDGFELASGLKKDELTSHIPIILLTARLSNESQIKGLESGVDDYLNKPIDLKVLHTRIKNLLHNRMLLQLRMAKELVIKPEEVTTNLTDEQFLKRVIQIVENNIGNPHFSVDSFSQEVGIGRTMLYKKMKQLTGESINEFIRKFRFKKAALLLVQSELTISEIAYSVGFSNIYSFSRAFNKEFRMSPSDWKNKNMGSIDT